MIIFRAYIYLHAVRYVCVRNNFLYRSENPREGFGSTAGINFSAAENNFMLATGHVEDIDILNNIVVGCGRNLQSTE